MTDRNLELLTAPDSALPKTPGWTRASFEETLQQLKRFQGLMKWRRVRLLVQNPFAVPSPLKTYFALMLLAPNSAEIRALTGDARIRVGLASVLQAVGRHSRQARQQQRALPELLEALRAMPLTQSQFAPSSAPPFYLRTNLWFGAKVGGSYSHATGIVNAFARICGAIDVATTDGIPNLDSSVAPNRIDLSKVEGWQAGTKLHFIANEGLFAEALRLCPRPPAFVYHRSALGDISGLRLARRHGRPLVLEYNGPEVWVAEKWGDGLPHAEAFSEIETLQLQRADLVLAISAPLVREAIERGVDPARILLSPNAVDAMRFGPDVSAEEMRQALGVGQRRAVILLSSFGPWHGAEIAVDAFADMINRRPDLAMSTILVLAGDGQRRKISMEMAEKRGLRRGETVLFPGMIPAERAPALLAMGDVLISPTTPNPDGSEFFGSPTKIFEYMAAGRTIVASDIAQVGEVLDHGRTAILVPPGDREALAQALADALDGKTPPELGANARRDAIGLHSWETRATAILDRVAALTR
jgi:glycosyltransferase involved in cell wall biosynthesis